jgi:hypothetical protein
MHGAERVALEMLGVPMAVEIEDVRWTEFILQLFAPFLADGRGETVPFVRVIPEEDGWAIWFSQEHVNWSADPWLLASRIRNALTVHAIRRAEGVIGIHSAVLSRDKIGLLIVGPAGSGKSTLAMRLLANGWEFLSDDLAPVKLDGLEVAPFPKPLSIKDASMWQEFEDLWCDSDWLPPPNHVLLVPARRLAAPELEPVRVAALLFPNFASGATTTLSPLSPGAAVARCAVNVLGPPLDDAGLRTLGVLCTDSANAEMSYGQSRDAVETLAWWVDQL